MIIDPDRMQPFRECMEEDYIIAHNFKSGKKMYGDDILCFDMEVCNYYIDCIGRVLSIKDVFRRYNYDLDKIEEAFKNELTPGGLPYIWMFGYNGRVIFGRELQDFKIFLEYLQAKFDYNAHIWVHNLSYEYTWLRELLQFDKVFFTEARNPLYAKIGSFTFR